MFDRRSDSVEKSLSSTAGSQLPEILSIEFLDVLRRGQGKCSRRSKPFTMACYFRGPEVTSRVPEQALIYSLYLLPILEV